MRIVFFGTPDYVLPILISLDKTFKRKGISPISAVVTQKPKPSGRKKILDYSAIDTWAHRNKVPVIYNPEDLIKNVKADLGVLAAYGAIIPKKVIDYFPHGILNIHPSLLPKLRGASPVQAAIVTGETQTGMSIIKIDEKVDHGPIISQFSEDIYHDDTTGVLRERLFEKSATVLATLISPYLDGKIKLREQDHNRAIFTNLLTKAHGFIPPEYVRVALKGEVIKGKWKIAFIKDFSINPTPEVIERFIRAMQPWPQAWTRVKLRRVPDGTRLRHAASPKRLKILKAHLEKSKVSTKGGSAYGGKSQMSKVRLVLDEVQLEGKNQVSWKQFKEAYPTALFKKGKV